MIVCILKLCTAVLRTCTCTWPVCVCHCVCCSDEFGSALAVRKPRGRSSQLSRQRSLSDDGRFHSQQSHSGACPLDLDHYTSHCSPEASSPLRNLMNHQTILSCIARETSLSAAFLGRHLQLEECDIQNIIHDNHSHQTEQRYQVRTTKKKVSMLQSYPQHGQT